MNQSTKAWLAGTTTFVAGTIGFTWLGRIAEALGGSGILVNAMIIGLMFGAVIMDKIDPKQ